MLVSRRTSHVKRITSQFQEHGWEHLVLIIPNPTIPNHVPGILDFYTHQEHGWEHLLLTIPNAPPPRDCKE